MTIFKSEYDLGSPQNINDLGEIATFAAVFYEERSPGSFQHNFWEGPNGDEEYHVLSGLTQDPKARLKDVNISVQLEDGDDSIIYTLNGDLKNTVETTSLKDEAKLWHECLEDAADYWLG